MVQSDTAYIVATSSYVFGPLSDQSLGCTCTHIEMLEILNNHGNLRDVILN